MKKKLYLIFGVLIILISCEKTVYIDIPDKGRKITIINHSNLLGKPLAALLINRGATVTVCHEFTKNLREFTKNAEIIITGVGKKNLIKEEMVRKGVVIIDAGILKIGNKVYGDVDLEKIKLKADYITPVPGGVGPMTVACLLENTVEAAENIEGCK